MWCVWLWSGHLKYEEAYVHEGCRATKKSVYSITAIKLHKYLQEIIFFLFCLPETVLTKQTFFCYWSIHYSIQPCLQYDIFSVRYLKWLFLYFGTNG
jgi:hypothetical protein